MKCYPPTLCKKGKKEITLDQDNDPNGARRF